MSASITLEQVRSVITVDGAVQYQIMNRILASEGVNSLAFFVYSTQTELYSHPATVYDVESYPETRAEALTQGLDFYRQAEATLLFADLATAVAAAAVIQSRISTLASDIPIAYDEFVGSTTYVYTGE